MTYTGSPLGAYSTERVMPAEHLIALRDDVDCQTAAASTMRGLTTGYLLRLIHPLKADYIADRGERAQLADEFFGHVAAGRITVEINQRYRLDEAVRAPGVGVRARRRFVGVHPVTPQHAQPSPLRDQEPP